MIWIQQLYFDEDIKRDYVRCINCHKGRLCDKAVGEKAVTIAIKSDQNKIKSMAAVILKCPRCGAKFIVHIGLNED